VADDVDRDATRASGPAYGWGAPPPFANPAQGPGFQQPQRENQRPQGYEQQQQGRTTFAATRSRVRRGLLWYLLLVALLGTVGMLSEAMSATISGSDPDLGAHPVKTTATVEDYDVFRCDRTGSCQYDEKVTFGTAKGTQQTVTIQGVDTRPTIGGIQTLWYPANDPSAAQTDGPHSAAYYWVATAGFGAAAALLVLVVVRRRRRTP
jgi:hypothetical protein